MQRRGRVADAQADAAATAGALPSSAQRLTTSSAPRVPCGRGRERGAHDQAAIRALSQHSTRQASHHICVSGGRLRRRAQRATASCGMVAAAVAPPCVCGTARNGAAARGRAGAAVRPETVLGETQIGSSARRRLCGAMGIRSTAPARPSAWNGSDDGSKKRRRRGLDGRGGDRRRRGPPAPRREDETTAASDSRDATRRQPLGADGRAATRGSAAKPCILSLIECLARTPGQELALEISAAFPRVLSSLGDFQRPTRAATVHVRRPWLCNSRRGMRMLRHDARSVEIPTHACEIDAP